jgi:hypothetical protein
MVKMQRFLRKIPLAGAAVLAVLSMSCGDSTTAPSRAAQRHASTGGTPSLDFNSGSFFGGGLRSTSFAVTSAGGTFQVGNLYTLNFPANSICDPAASSYGPGTWDDPCTTLADGQSVTITASYGFTSSGLVVDFQPALRFNPNTKVTISTGVYAFSLTLFSNYYAANPSALHYLGIYYTPNLGATSLTDAGRDPSLVTHVNLKTGLVWRRIKHFSGYNVFTGLPCDPSPDDPDCVDDGGPIIDGGSGGDGS